MVENYFDVLDRCLHLNKCFISSLAKNVGGCLTFPRAYIFITIANIQLRSLFRDGTVQSSPQVFALGFDILKSFWRAESDFDVDYRASATDIDIH